MKLKHAVVDYYFVLGQYHGQYFDYTRENVRWKLRKGHGVLMGIGNLFFEDCNETV